MTRAQLHSARLMYRAMGAEDAPALHNIVSQWAVVRQMGPFPWPPDPAFTATRAAPYQGDGFEWGMFLGGTLIGTIGIHGNELGYMIDPAHHRRGFARESVAFAIAHSKLPRIEAEIWIDNAASLALLQSLGFVEFDRREHLSKARGVRTQTIRLAYTAPRP